MTGNDDRKLLEMAAKAAGVEIEWHCWPASAKEAAYFKNGDAGNPGGECYSTWNPLTDDGDALRLAVKLNMGVKVNDDDHWQEPNRTVVIWDDNCARRISIPHGKDKSAATRRAITRAAAAIGEAME